jgi:hypothetical protein
MTVPTIIILKLRIADSRLSFIPKRYPANHEKTRGMKNISVPAPSLGLPYLGSTQASE